MDKYQVDYFYLATGMEGRADERDYGIVEAENEREAKEKACLRRHPDFDEDDRAFMMGCLSAKKVSI